MERQELDEIELLPEMDYSVLENSIIIGSNVFEGHVGSHSFV